MAEPTGTVPERPGGVPAGWRSNLLLALASTLAALLAAELALRGYDAWRGLGFLRGYRSPSLAARFENVRTFRIFGFEAEGGDPPGSVILDRHRRVPLAKPAGGLRIGCFGGSSTENVSAYARAGVDYPGLLAGRLAPRHAGGPVEVLNLGNGAYTTAHSLVLMQIEASAWDLDVAALSHNINDLFVSYWPGYRRDYAHAYLHPFYVGPLAEQTSLADAILHHSQLYWAVKRRLQRAFPPEVPMRRRPAGRRPLPAAEANFRRYLGAFVDLCRAQGTTPVLATQPLRRDEPAFLAFHQGRSFNDSVVYPLHEEFLAHHDRFNELLREVARETGTLLCDNAARVPGGPGLFFDQVHYTPEGVRRLTGAVADCLLGAGLPQLADRPAR